MKNVNQMSFESDPDDDKPETWIEEALAPVLKCFENIEPYYVERIDDATMFSLQFNEQTWTCHFLLFYFCWTFVPCYIRSSTFGHVITVNLPFHMYSQVVAFSVQYPAQNVSHIVCGISLLVVLSVYLSFILFFLSFHCS